jgi:hypothetical protein
MSAVHTSKQFTHLTANMPLKAVSVFGVGWLCAVALNYVRRLLIMNSEYLWLRSNRCFVLGGASG